jgi:hypothetical protein
MNVITAKVGVTIKNDNITQKLFNKFVIKILSRIFWGFAGEFV